MLHKTHFQINIEWIGINISVYLHCISFAWFGSMSAACRFELSVYSFIYVIYNVLITVWIYVWINSAIFGCKKNRNFVFLLQLNWWYSLFLLYEMKWKPLRRVQFIKCNVCGDRTTNAMILDIWILIKNTLIIFSLQLDIIIRDWHIRIRDRFF